MSERLICVIGAIRFLLLVFSIFTLFLSFLKAFFFCSIPLRDASAESRRILVQPHTMSVFLFLFWERSANQGGAPMAPAESHLYRWNAAAGS